MKFDKRIFKIVPFFITLFLVLFFVYQLGFGEETFIEMFINQYRYFAAFVLAFLSGFLFAFPIPASVWINYYTSAGLAYVPLIIILTIGQTLVDFISLLVASFLENIVEDKYKKFITFVDRFKKRARNIPLLIFFLWVIFAPLPNEVLGYVMVFLGYKLRVLMPIIFVGNIFFNLIITKIVGSDLTEVLLDTVKNLIF